MKGPKVLRTWQVPRTAVRKDCKDPVTLNVYADFKPLLVTRDVNIVGDAFRLTHEPTGLAFGLFESVTAAKRAARRLHKHPGFALVVPEEIVKASREVVMQVLADVGGTL